MSALQILPRTHRDIRIVLSTHSRFMETQTMTFASIRERMMTPWAMTIKEIVHSYMYLVSVYGQKTLEHCEASILAATLEGQKLTEGMTATKAKALTKMSNEGQRLTILAGELKVIEEMIRALKKAQNYQSTDEHHNR